MGGVPIDNNGVADFTGFDHMQRVLTLQVAIKDKFKDSIKDGKLVLNPAQISELLRMPKVAEMGVGRFVQDMMIGKDANLKFGLTQASREQLAWCLGDQTRDITNTKPQQLKAEAQRAFEMLNRWQPARALDQAVTPEQFPDPALFMAFANGQQGVVQSTGPDGRPQELWIKQSPRNLDAALATAALSPTTFEAPAEASRPAASDAFGDTRLVGGFKSISVQKLDETRAQVTIPPPELDRLMLNVEGKPAPKAAVFTFDLSTPKGREAYNQVQSPEFQAKVTAFLNQNPRTSFADAVAFFLRP